jgi:hypothetical protein
MLTTLHKKIVERCEADPKDVDPHSFNALIMHGSARNECSFLGISSRKHKVGYAYVFKPMVRSNSMQYISEPINKVSSIK